MPRRSKTQELLEFEIHFYEKLLTAYPDFIDVLIPLGDAYTRRGLFEKGLAVDQRLIQLKGQDPKAWYNLACSLSLLQRIDEALDALRKAFELGYNDLPFLNKDPDLMHLRQSPKFRVLLEAIASKLSPQPSQEGRQAAS